MNRVDDVDYEMDDNEPVDLKKLAAGEYHNKINANMISKVRKKTGKVIPLLLMPEARMILENFDSDDYIFPILNSSAYKTEAQIMGRIDRTGTKINSALQMIAKELYINKKITMYYVLCASFTGANVV